jgi:hypothetical protein
MSEDKIRVMREMIQFEIDQKGGLYITKSSGLVAARKRV